MRGFRYVFRGLSDTLNHLLPFTLYSLLWWLSALPVVLSLVAGLWVALAGLIVLIVPVSAATVALFSMADPRRTEGLPDLRAALETARAGARRGWVLGLITVLVIVVLLNNIWYYGSHSSIFAVLIILWLLLLVLTLAIGLSAFALVALADASAGAALKRAALLVAVHPIRAIMIVLLLTLLGFISAGLVVPLIMFAPATLAAVVNRFVLDGLGLPIPDPLAPTEERQQEDLVKKAQKSGRFGRG